VNETFTVAGVRIDAVDLDECVARVTAWIDDGAQQYVVLTGAHGVVEMQSDAELRSINNGAGLVTPDGMSVVWFGRALGHGQTRKVYAPTIMHALMAEGLKHGWRHYFYGGAEGVAEALVDQCRRDHPGLEIAGTHCPPFRPLADEEASSVASAIDATEPHVVWVGLGCPKQERWMARFRPLLRTPVLIGVGAGFDFLSGRKPLAPTWVQQSGFEWLYRTVSEPRRLGRRYAKVVPRFLFHAGRDLAGRLLNRR